MNKFDRNGTQDDVLFGGSEIARGSRRRGNAKAGPYSLAASADEMACNVLKQGVFGLDRVKKLFFDPAQISRQRRNLLERTRS